MLWFERWDETRFADQPAGTSLAAASSCSAYITSLQPGDRVGWRVTVKGTANVPDGHHLWVIERDRRRNRWYLPRIGGAPDVTDGEWAVEMQFGREQDVPRETFVATAVVGDDVHRWLRKRLADESRYGVDFPDTVPGCPIDMVSIVRDK
jgi:hypothetical protein